MPTKKNKVRDLKPQKDAKGGGGGALQGSNVGLPPNPAKGGQKIVNPLSTEGGTGNK